MVLNFEISPRSDPVTIQKGSRFSCMKDEDSKDVIFEVNDELNVSDAKIRDSFFEISKRGHDNASL